MSNETVKFNVTKGQKVYNLEAAKIETVKNVEKRGRWIYITVGNGPELTEKQFNAAYVLNIPTDSAKQAAPKAPRVNKVSEAKVQDAMTGSDIQDGTIEGLTGFAKFRALHKAETVELEVSGVKVRVQDNGDDIAHSLLCGIDEIIDATGMEASEAIWMVPMVKNNLDVKALKARYANLNYGMIRMNIGNLLRGLYRRASEAAKK